MSKIMIVTGGKWQCPLVRTAKQMGHHVLCTNLYKDSPAFRYADIGIAADVLDAEKNLEIARQYQPDAVLTDQSDIAVPTVAYIAEQLGLRGITQQKAWLFTNKFLMREFTKARGFANPEYALCHNVQEAADFLALHKKCILKPLDSQSSRGIHIVGSEEELPASFEDALQCSRADKAILAEQYIDGVEFTVDGIKSQGSYRVTAISQKEHFAFNRSIASRLLFSSTNTDFDYEKLRRINTDMVLQMDLPFGLTHAEYKYYNGEFYLIEIAARGGGTRISSDIVPLVSGINSNRLLIQESLGQKADIKIGPHHEYAVLGFFDFKPGIVEKVCGLDEAKQIPGVYDFELELNVGERLQQAGDDRSRNGYYIIYADRLAELEQTEKQLKQTIHVVTK